MLNNKIECKLREFWLPASSVQAGHRIGFNYAQPLSLMGLQSQTWLTKHTHTHLSIHSYQYLMILLPFPRFENEDRDKGLKQKVSCLTSVFDHLALVPFGSLNAQILIFFHESFWRWHTHMHMCTHTFTHFLRLLTGSSWIHWCYILWVSAYDLVSDF